MRSERTILVRSIVRLIMLTFVLCLAWIGRCQEDYVEVEEGSFVGGYRSFVPDPDSPLAIATFAKHSAIADHIQLSAEKRAELQELFRAARGSLSVIMFPSKVNGRQLDNNEIEAIAIAKRDANLVNLMKIFTPEQLNRLGQIVRQIEVQRVGLTEAFVDGHMSQAAQVKDYQKSGLRISLEVIEKRFLKALLELREKTNSELIQALTEGQQSKAEDLLGKPFLFVEVMEKGQPDWSSKGLDGRIRNYVTPNPDSTIELVSLLTNASVRKEVRVDESELESILRRMEKYGQRLTNVDVPRIINGRRTTKNERETLRNEGLEENKELATMAIDPLQVERLKQVAYHVEISRIGFVEALLVGRLGEAIGVDASQTELIRSIGQQANQKFEKGVLDLLDLVYSDAIKQLDPIQRDPALRALGKAFFYQSTQWQTDTYLKRSLHE